MPRTVVIDSFNGRGVYSTDLSWRRPSRGRIVAAAFPRCGQSEWTLVAPLLAMEFAFALVVQARHEFDLFHPIVWLYFGKRMLVDAAAMLAVVGMIHRLPAGRVCATAFVAAYLFLLGADAAIYRFGGTLFERHHLALIASYSIRPFLGWEVTSLTGLWIAGTWAAWAALHPNPDRAPITAVRWACLAAAIALANPPHLASRALALYQASSLSAPSGRPRDPSAAISTESIDEQLGYASRNSLFNFAAEVATGRASKFETIHALEGFERAIDRYALPLGPREYRPLGLRPFRTIVLVTTESLSLDLLAPYNASLPQDLTPFYGSNEIRAAMFTNYRTSGTPTLQGLVAALNSHPNAALSLEIKHPDSLVKILRGEGYETVFLRGASRFFASENVIFKDMGYGRIVAREDFEARESTRPFVKGWGAYDRILYDEAVDLIEDSGSEKLFLQILGVDTHPPGGREGDDGGFAYPAPSASVRAGLGAAGKGADFLRSVAHHDFDVGTFIKRLKAEGLWTQDLLVILTADHACPVNSSVQSIPGYPRDPLARIPLAFLTPRLLPEAPRDRVASQLDLAPSLLHLLGLPVPPGYWGESVFAETKRNPAIGVFQKLIVIQGESESEKVRLAQASDPIEEELLSLYARRLAPANN